MLDAGSSAARRPPSCTPTPTRSSGGPHERTRPSARPHGARAGGRTPPGAGEPVVLLHPLALSGELWRPLAAALADEFDVSRLRPARARRQRLGRPAVLDRGPGPRRRRARWTRSGCAPSACSACRWAAASRSTFAGLFPERVRSLVLADTTAWYGEDAVAAWAERAERAVAVPRERAGPVPGRPLVLPGVPRRATPTRSTASREIFLRTDSGAHAAASIAMGRLDSRRLLPAVTRADPRAGRRGRLRDAARDGRGARRRHRRRRRCCPCPACGTCRSSNGPTCWPSLRPARVPAPAAGDGGPMKPGRFAYHAPRELDEALALLQELRRRGEGAGRRPEPDADAELPARPDRAPRRHQPARRRAGRAARSTTGHDHDPGAGPAAPASSAPPRSPRLLPLLTDALRAGRAPADPQPRHRLRQPRPRRPGGRAAERHDGAGRAVHDRLGATASARSPPPTSSSSTSPPRSSRTSCCIEVTVDRPAARRTVLRVPGVRHPARRLRAGRRRGGVRRWTTRASSPAAGSPRPASRRPRSGSPTSSGSPSAAASDRRRCWPRPTRPRAREVDPTGDIHASAAVPHAPHRRPGQARARRRADPAGGGPCLSPTTATGSRCTVNGDRHDEVVDDRLTLADFLRERLRLTGTHLGCEHGVCGACTVLVDGAAVRSCLMLAVQADGARDRDRREPRRGRRAERRCRRRSSATTPCSAASARPGS